MAQTPVWIQIETRPSLLEIEDRARAYSAKLPNINAFSLGSGWYVIAMGPFSEEIADAQRRDLQSRLAIPGDSFVPPGRAMGRKSGQAICKAEAVWKLRRSPHKAVRAARNAASSLNRLRI